MGRRSLALALVLAVSLGATAPVASAHTELTSTTPKAGSYAKRSLSKVRARFSQPIRSGELQVLRAGEKVSVGSGQRSPGDVRAIEAKIEDELEGGRYVVRWTMTAVDGHTQRGSWRFRVRPEPAAARTEATPTPTAEPSASPAATPVATVEAARTAEDGAGTNWLLIGGFVVVALLAAAGMIGARRRRRALDA